MNNKIEDKKVDAVSAPGAQPHGSGKSEVEIEADEDSIEITVPKLKVDRIKMRFGGVRIAIHDSDKPE